MNDPWQKDSGSGGSGFGQWQNEQSPQMFNQMLSRGGATPYQQQGLKSNRGNPNRFGPPENGGINPGGMFGGGGYGAPGNTGPIPPPPGPQRPPMPNPYDTPGNTGPIPPPPGPQRPNPYGYPPGNTGPIPPPPGMERPGEITDPRRTPHGPPPPTGEPPPFEFQRPWLGQTGYQQNPNMIGGGQRFGHPGFNPGPQLPVENPIRPQRPMRNPYQETPQDGQGYGVQPFQWRT